MSFSQTIKKEIISKELDNLETTSLLSGIILTSGYQRSKSYILKISNSFISESIRNILDKTKINFSTANENKNWIILNNFIPNNEIKNPSVFFAGVFLGGGSISDPKSTSYHLEIQFHSHLDSLRCQKFLNKYSFDFSLIQRRKNWVLYLKKSEMISDFMKAIEAFNSLIEFEDERISRDFKNQLNRYSNLDSYNQKKLAHASVVFLEDYKFILKNNLMHLFNKNELLFFETKKNNPYSSLQDLIKIFQKKTGETKTKSAFNHYLIKLRKIIKIKN